MVRLDTENMLQDLSLPKGGMQLIDNERQRLITDAMRQLNPQLATGGSAGNAILALARLGADVAFVGKVADDGMGRLLADHMRSAGIDARLIQGSGSTGVANTFITPDGQRTFATHLGAAATMTAQDITPDMLQGCSVLHIEGYLVQNHELIEHVARMAHGMGATVSLDLGSHNVVSADLPFFRHLVQQYVDIVFANEEESAAFTQGLNPQEALQQIAGMCRVAVVKLGARGSSAMCGTDRAWAAAQQVPVVDTTAAGDFFAGGFLYAYSHGRRLEDCLRTGALLSRYVIQVVGTQLPAAAWNEIKRELS